MTVCWSTVYAGQAKLSWIAPTENTDGSPLTDLAEYGIFWGCTESRQYTDSITISAPAETYTIEGLPDEGVCYFATTAINTSGVASLLSNEAVKDFGLSLPGKPSLEITWGDNLVTFPVVQSVTETSFASDTTSHEVSMPATVTADDLLFLGITTHTAATYATPSGWTKQYDESDSFGRGAGFVKVADGTEGSTTVDVVTSNAQAGAAHVYRITGWDGTLAGVEHAVLISSGASPNPPSLSPSWGAEDTLWLVFSQTADDDQAVTATPTNYTDLVDTACGAGADSSGRTASARRELNTATEDPDSFSIQSSETWIATTLAIRTGTAGGGGGLAIPIAAHHLRQLMGAQ